MAKPIKFTLAGQEYEVPPLELGQLEEILVISAVPDPDKKVDPAGEARSRFNRMRVIVAAALAGLDGVQGLQGADAEGLKKWRITRDELVAANNAILVGSGLATEGEAAPAQKLDRAAAE